MTRSSTRHIRGLDGLDAAAPLSNLDGFVPPPRFGATSFEAYEPAHPTQDAARSTVSAFVRETSERHRPKRFRLPWAKPETGSGLYLDGGFGVGKTHLLAAAWHAAALPARRKRYLSFQELVYVLGVLGREGARESFADVALVCLDEFELDDPGNTLVIATFLREAFERGTAVITTSNTPPEAQGTGRFAAQDFRREIQGIADRFDVVAIDGPDHRAGLRQVGWSSNDALDEAETRASGTIVTTDGAELAATLERLHPVRYRSLLHDVDLLIVRDLRPIPDQNAALRFVHFVDKLYDLGIGFRASGSAALTDTFDVAYREGAYAKKHHRCVSRLTELLQEPLPGDGRALPSERMAAAPS